MVKKGKKKITNMLSVNYLGQVIIPPKNNGNSAFSWKGSSPSYVKSMIAENNKPFGVRSTQGANMFQLKNQDPFANFGTRNMAPRIKEVKSNKLRNIRWVDMVGNKKYNQYTANPFGDSDNDGVLNIFDCRPGNQWYRDEFADGTLSAEEKSAALAAERAAMDGPLHGRQAAARKAKKKLVDGFETVFNQDGSPAKSQGGKPRLTSAQVTEREKLRAEQAMAKAISDVSRGFRVATEGSIAAQERTKQVEQREKTRRLMEQRKYDKMQEKNANKELELQNKLKKTQNASNKIVIQEQLNKIKQQGVVLKKKRLDVELQSQYTKRAKAETKAQKEANKAFSRARKKEIFGSDISLLNTSKELQATARVAGIHAEKVHDKIYGESRINPETGREHRVGGYKDKLFLKNALVSKIEKHKQTHPNDKSTIMRWENELAEKYSGVSETGLKNLYNERDAELAKQKAQTARSDTVGGLYASKTGTKQKIYGGIGTIFRTDAGKVQRVFEDTAGLARAAKKQVKKGFSRLDKTTVKKGKIYAERAKGFLGAITSTGGIGGVYGNAVTGYRGGSTVGDRQESYYGDTLSEAEYAKKMQEAPKPEEYEKNWKGAGRPEGTYKYGMPINEYKAMKREQEQTMRLQEALREQAITQQLSSDVQTTMNSSESNLPMGFAQTRTPTSLNQMGGMPSGTIGSGSDVISSGSVMTGNAMGRKHSSQVIFPGLHANAKTAKIPWLPSDPIMIRDPERLPVYYTDQDSAEHARNTQVFNVTSLPMGSPLVGPVGYQYAGRIKEIKAPQTKNMIMQTQNDGIVKMNPTMKANPWGLMIKNRLNFSESNILDEDLRGNVISRDQIGGNIMNAPNMFTHDQRATGVVNRFGEGERNIPFAANAGIGSGQYPLVNPEVTGLGTTYVPFDQSISFSESLEGHPQVATANPFRGITQRGRVEQPQPLNEMEKQRLLESRQEALSELRRLKQEEDYVKQVAVQEGLKEADAVGGKGFLTPQPLFQTIKGMVMKKGPSATMKQISVLEQKQAELSQQAAEEVADITPGSPLPLNLMSNAKGDFESLPIALKQQVIEEEIYQKQDEEMQNRYNAEQKRYQTNLREEMRQAAALRKAQMDAAKKQQMAAEQILAARGSISNPTPIQRAQPVEYLTGEILDPYYDEEMQVQQQQQSISQQAMQQQILNTQQQQQIDQNGDPYSENSENMENYYPGVANNNTGAARASSPVPK